tara:strand:- start:5119 stop:6024 length:906 start_codon:yes stop_codon:yes gene_type:complete
MFKVLGFYKFFKVVSLKKNKKFINDLLIFNNIKGTIIISKEGLNGSIAGKPFKIKVVSAKIKKHFKFKNFDSENLSQSIFQPFHKPKVKIKKEVVPMNLLLTKKIKNKNSRVNPNKWNSLISDKNTYLIDARKPFEYNVGTFKKANNPNIQNFRDFPKYLTKLNKDKPIAMFCTGGIRCEKASVYLEKKGFKNIYQLKGGIINYLKKIPKEKSLWKGECFVFDNRVSLKHGLNQGTYSICSGCRKPISRTDTKSKKYELGVSCPKCHDILTSSQKKRFRMRQSQINLAKNSGKRHIFQKQF